ncbi:MAG: aminofutalosine synthase MqnE [Nitrospirae bacterium]|nr:aminofutalosine synthase MqnE [Nitrospirota bacterium]
MLEEVIEKINSGRRLDRDDALALFQSDDIFTLGEVAAQKARDRYGDRVFYTRNRHVNPTNVCVNRCRFCAFSRSKGQDDAYTMSVEEVIHKLVSVKSSFTEVHIVGGLHPDLPFSFYLDLLSAIKSAFPGVHIKAFTAVEIDYFSKISGLGIEDTLVALKKSGLDALPGGGAEIFSPSVRQILCPDKISASRWLAIHGIAHSTGLKTNATMLYGHVESYEDRVDHLFMLREQQAATGGFQAFIPLAFQPLNSDIKGKFPSGIDDLKTIAISRLVLDNFPHIKAYWIMLGEKITQASLFFGADDVDGTVVEEKIAHSAGADSKEMLTVEEMEHLIRKAGKTPVERDCFYAEIRRN